MQKHRPVMLVILDGWGATARPTMPSGKRARTPTFDELWRSCPHAFLQTSGWDVGLPPHDSALRCIQGQGCWALTREVAPDIGARQN